MSYDPRFDAPAPIYPEPRSNTGGMFIGFLFGAGMLIAASAYLFPVLHKQWNDADITQKVRMREAEARAEAEVEFRKAEARLKAEAQAAGIKLANLDIAPTAFKAVASKAGPAVVNITSLLKVPQGMTKSGEGSGVIYKIDKDPDGLPSGYIVTNSHVIHKANSNSPYDVTDRVAINFASGRTIIVEGNAIYHDPLVDIAVIKFDAGDFDHLVTAEWGDSNNCSVGDVVVAIGSPFGLKQSVTTGIISAKGRTELRQKVETEVLQTDAAINVGNSGGPLLDLKGRVIGINVAIATQNGMGGSNGVGFSIPSNTAKEVVEVLLKPPHKIRRGFLGIRIGDLIDPRLGAKAGVDGGAVVASVNRGSAAEKGGLKTDDLVIRLKVKDKEIPIRSGDELRQNIRDLRSGDKIELEVLRGVGGRAANIEKVNLVVTLDELPQLDLEQQPDQFFNPNNQQKIPQQQGRPRNR